MLSSFGSVIAGARKALRLSRKQLAARLRWHVGSSVSSQYLANLEGGHREPADDLVYLLARELNLVPDGLFHRLQRLPPDVRLIQPDESTIRTAYMQLRQSLLNQGDPHAP